MFILKQEKTHLLNTLKCNKILYETIRICVYENKICLNLAIKLFIVITVAYKTMWCLIQNNDYKLAF